MPKFQVTFLPDHKTISVEKDTTILSAAISAGIYINSNCGGDGICGRCKVIVQGNVIAQPNAILTPQEQKNNIYLACLATIQGDLKVEIPENSRINFDKLTPRELEERLNGLYSKTVDISTIDLGKKYRSFEHSSFTTKVYLELPKPTLEDSLSDLERLYRGLSKFQKLPPVETGLFNIRQLGQLLRDYNWKITVTLGRRENVLEIICIEPGDTSAKNFGFCFDIGTTTISGQLIDLDSKKILGTKATYNQQAVFGSDVITRIVHAAKAHGLEQLHNAVCDTINQIIQDLATEHQIDLNTVNSIVCSGNTTMIHLLLNMDPAHIRKEPYIPTANFLPIVRAAETGIKINPRGLLYCVPGVSSYLGGDTTAGVVSSRLYENERPCILIDIGTNGEIVLGNKEFLVGCAASAGPAFEGSGVTCGMRASSGAIQKIEIDEKNFKVNYSVIQDKRPKGICGSGYIDLLSEMLDAGIIDKSGKIQIEDQRIRLSDQGKEFIICFKEETQTGQEIVISEADIENLKRSKGAIYSATSILVNHLGLDYSNIQKFYIAGGFGTYLDIEKAIRIGLLPDIDRSKFVFIGNSSLAGSREILLSQQARQTADRLATKITYFELSNEPAYMEEYGQALFFPHTDLSKFPTVRH